MEILLNTDSSIQGREEFADRLGADIAKMLERVSDHITRIEVHLSVEGGKHGHDDKRCLLEARMEGHLPLAVTEHSQSIDKAVHGACEKMRRLIDTTMGRIHTKQKSTPHFVDDVTDVC